MKQKRGKLKATRYCAGMPRVNDGAASLPANNAGESSKPSRRRAAAASPSSSTARHSSLVTAVGRKRDSPLDSGERLARSHRRMPEQLFYNTGIPTYVWVLRS